MKICFIGGGNMATALIGGMLGKGCSAEKISVVEIDPGNRARLQRDFGVYVSENIAEGVKGCEVVVFAVKPQQLRDVALEIAPQVSGKLLLSIAAGVLAKDIARWCNSQSVIRAMPNTPALIQSGMTGLYALPEVSKAQREQAQNILSAVGEVLWLENEKMMDGITAISGSGPAYVFYFIEALQKAALKFGFKEEDARRLSLATFLGASKLAVSSEHDVSVLRARVTSKSGTTERALLKLEASHVAERIAEAAIAAADRSRELGEELGQESREN